MSTGRGTQPKRRQRLVQLSSTLKILRDLWTRSLKPPDGPESHIAALGQALLRLWAKPLEDCVRRRRENRAYKKVRHQFAAVLAQLCGDVSRALDEGPTASERLRAMARILAVSLTCCPFYVSRANADLLRYTERMLLILTSDSNLCTSSRGGHLEGKMIEVYFVFSTLPATGMGRLADGGSGCGEVRGLGYRDCLR